MSQYIESMQEMKNRLGDSGASGQVKAVIAAISAINKAPGVLDQRNRATALFHLAVAITGTEESAVSALQDAISITQAFED